MIIYFKVGLLSFIPFLLSFFLPVPNKWDLL